VYLLVFTHTLTKSTVQEAKSPVKISTICIYDVNFLALPGAAYIYDVSRLRVNIVEKKHYKRNLISAVYLFCKKNSIYFNKIGLTSCLHKDRLFIVRVTSSGRVISIVYSSCGFVAVGIQQAMSLRLIVTAACSAVHKFSTLSHKRHNFRKQKFIEK
jgi:hypothetical protein